MLHSPSAQLQNSLKCYCIIQFKSREGREGEVKCCHPPLQILLPGIPRLCLLWPWPLAWLSICSSLPLSVSGNTCTCTLSLPAHQLVCVCGRVAIFLFMLSWYHILCYIHVYAGIHHVSQTLADNNYYFAIFVRTLNLAASTSVVESMVQVPCPYLIPV